MHQREQLDEVIHSDGDDGGAERCCGESDEAALPLESEHGEQRSRAQKDAQGDPHGPGVVELFHHLQERGGLVLAYYNYINAFFRFNYSDLQNQDVSPPEKPLLTAGPEGDPP